MKKTVIVSIFMGCMIFSTFAYDTHSTLAASLGFGSESGTANGVSASASLGNFGLFSGASIFPNDKNIGFHFDIDLHFINWASNSEGGVGTSSLGGSKSFALNSQILLAPSFKKETDSILLQFSPGLSFGLEMETGTVYSYSYNYTGFLFGFGGDVSLAFVPTNKCSFVMGTHLAYYPVYAPSITVNKKEYDIDFDSYGRFMINFYLGVQIHHHK